MKIFCERLKELRQDKNMSITELAKALDVNASTVTRWKNNLRVPVIDQLYKIAVFFGVSSDYLIGLED